jgi:hypothetical protein
LSFSLNITNTKNRNNDWRNILPCNQAAGEALYRIWLPPPFGY